MALPGNLKHNVIALKQQETPTLRITADTSFSSRISSPQAPNISPTDENGNALSPDAYKLWQPKLVKGETLQPGQFRKKLAELTQNLSMTKPKAQVQPKNKLEKLNEWLSEPILRKEVMPRVMKSERYTVEYDEAGEAIGVVE